MKTERKKKNARANIGDWVSMNYGGERRTARVMNGDATTITVRFTDDKTVRTVPRKNVTLVPEPPFRRVK